MEENLKAVQTAWAGKLPKLTFLEPGSDRVILGKSLAPASFFSRGFGLAFWFYLISILFPAIALPAEITSFSQFYEIPQDQIKAGMPVRISGTIVCYDVDWGQLYFHDGKISIYINPRLFDQPLEFGQKYEITGQAITAGQDRTFTNLSLHLLSKDTLPSAIPLDLPQLTNFYGQWVEVTGRVRVAETSRGRLGIVLHHGQKSCQIYVMGTMKTNDYKWLLDHQVRLRGINGSRIENGRLLASMMVPSVDEVKLLDRASDTPFPGPVTTIPSLLTRAPGSWTNQRVHLNGTVVSSESGKHLFISEPTGVIRAETSQATPVKTGERVDVWGYPVILPGDRYLSDSFYEMFAAASPIVPIAGISQVEAGAPLKLWRVSEVLQLPPSESKKNLAVRLRGVVTFVDEAWGNGFIQDGTNAIYFSHNQRGLKPGQYVEVTGRTSPGAFAPDVHNCTVQILQASNLPPVERLELAEVMNGNWDARWIQLEGVVQEFTQESGHLRLNLMAWTGPFSALVPNPDNQPLPDNLLDARVSLQGACVTTVNPRQQLSSISLNVPSLDYLQILEPGMANRFAGKPVPINTIGQYAPGRKAGHQLQVAGVVTLILPGEGFYLQDTSAGLKVQTLGTNAPSLNHQVEAAGFPLIGGDTPSLNHAIWRQLGSNSAIVPIATSARRILNQGTNNGMLVKLQATLLRDVAPESPPELLVQDDGIIFLARIKSPQLPAQHFTWNAGTVLSLTGVCVSQDGTQGSSSFELLLRQSYDIEVLRNPPWWNTRNALVVAGGLLAVILLGALWNLLLWHEVRRQSGIVADKLRQEAALEERYRQLVASSNDLVWEANPDHICTFASQHISSMLGYTPSEAIGQSFLQLIAPEETSRAKDLLAACAARRESFHAVEISCRHKSGQRIPCEMAAVPMLSPQGQWLGTRGTLRDITERTRAEAAKASLEAQLRQAQKMEAVGTLAGGIAHDFNNILGIIIPYVDLAKSSAGGNAELLTSLTEIGLAARRAADLVKQMLTFSRQANIQLKPAQLQPVIKEVLKMLRSVLPSSIEIVDRIDPGTSHVLADPIQIHQIIMNLCTNATHAMNNGPGRIEVTLEPFAPGDEFYRMHQEISRGKLVRLAVADTGHGMDSATLKRIFEPFFTTKGPKEGTGLGLAVVHGIVKEHRGCIQVSSQLGVGTTFEIFFPGVEPANPAQAPKRSPMLQGNGERILMVDDERQLVSVGERFLRIFGYQPQCCTDPVVALELFRRQPAAFDLIITDLTMPKMTGLDFARQVTELRPGIPIILATGFSHNLTQADLDKLGIAELINKPIEPENLAIIIQRTLHKTPAVAPETMIS